MRKGTDLVTEFPGLVVIHQKIPGREVGRHQHREHEFFLPLQGEITLQFGEKRVTGGPGRMIYAPPDRDHSFSSSAHGEGERVIFLISQKAWDRHEGGKFEAASVPASALVRELIFFLLLHPRTRSPAFLAALVQATSEQLSVAPIGGDLSHLSGKVADPRIQKAVQEMENAAVPPSMAELARKSGVSPRNFNRLFLKETGFTPKQLANRFRIERAQRLLASSRRTVTDIALEVGYQSLSRFISAFQKHTGELPSEYRRKTSRDPTPNRTQ